MFQKTGQELVRKDHLSKNLLWLVVNKRNHTSTSRFNEFNIRSGDVGGIRSVIKPSGGAITGMSEDSDDRPEIEGWVRHRAGGDAS